MNLYDNSTLVDHLKPGAGVPKSVQHCCQSCSDNTKSLVSEAYNTPTVSYAEEVRHPCLQELPGYNTNLHLVGTLLF